MNSTSSSSPDRSARKPRIFAGLALAFALAGAAAFPSNSFGQAAKEPRQKEPTDGFFDVPAGPEEPSFGVPAYMVTGGLAGLAMFILCKSARRS